MSSGIDTYSAALQLAERQPIGVVQSPLVSDREDLLLDDRVRRSHQLRVGDGALERQMLEDPRHLAVAFLIAAEVGREIRVAADGAVHVGYGKAGEHLAVRHVFDGKRHGHRHHGASHASLTCGHPERGPAAERRDLWTRERHPVEQKRRRLDLRDTEFRHVRLRVAHEEIVDVVLARVDAGRKGRPRRRRLRRDRRLEPGEPAALDQPRERRHLTALEVQIEQRGSMPSNPRTMSFGAPGPRTASTPTS